MEDPVNPRAQLAAATQANAAMLAIQMFAASAQSSNPQDLSAETLAQLRRDHAHPVIAGMIRGAVQAAWLTAAPGLLAGDLLRLVLENAEVAVTQIVSGEGKAGEYWTDLAAQVERSRG